ncbi:unnamed protein product [Hapterophycus canaliculatus]
MRGSALLYLWIGLSCLRASFCPQVEGLAILATLHFNYDCSSDDETGTYFLAFGHPNLNVETSTSSLG